MTRFIYLAVGLFGSVCLIMSTTSLIQGEERPSSPEYAGWFVQALILLALIVFSFTRAWALFKDDRFQKMLMKEWGRDEHED